MKKLLIILVSVAVAATLMLSLRSFVMHGENAADSPPETAISNESNGEDAANVPSELIISDKNSGEVYLTYSVSPSERFSVTFVHSVNQSPVTDVYEIRDDGIWLVENIYYAFGAGVPAELKNDEYKETGPDNSMVIKNMDTLIDELVYVVGTVSDHTLEIGGETVSLRDACGKNSHVLFSVK